MRWFIACTCLLLTACATSNNALQPTSLAPTRAYDAADQHRNAEANERFNELFGFYENKALHHYVRAVGSRVSAHLPYDFKFIILDTDYVNAFSVSGGDIYITRGMLAHLATEAELAAVLAHEVAHVVTQHSVRNHQTIPATPKFTKFFANWSGTQKFEDGVRQGRTSGAVRGAAQQDELMADRLAIDYLKKSGYQTSAVLGMLRLIESVQQLEKELATYVESPKFNGQMLTGHPAIGQRYAEVAKWTETADVVQNQRDRKRYLDIIEGMEYGNDIQDPRMYALGTNDMQQQQSQQLRIQVVAAGDGETYAELSRYCRLQNNAEAIVRTLNRAYPEGEPQPGQLVKIVK